MNAFVTVFKYAANRADAAYRKAIASGVGEDAALEERKAEFYYGLFRFFFDPNLSKWNAAGGAA